HDQEEAMTMADSIAVMNHGRIERLGSPSEIYEDPRTPFVAGFLGASNLMHGTVSGNDVGLPNGAVIRLTDHQAARCNGHREVQIGVRPEKLSFYGRGTSENTPANRLTGVIADASFLGTSTQYLVEVPGIGQVAVVEQTLGEIHAPGEEAVVAWKPAHTFVADGPPPFTSRNCHAWRGDAPWCPTCCSCPGWPGSSPSSWCQFSG